ncbi:MAG TPA: hypothetical protein VF365_03445 [Candidatus Limnocylindria bacterium]
MRNVSSPIHNEARRSCERTRLDGRRTIATDHRCAASADVRSVEEANVGDKGPGSKSKDKKKKGAKADKKK